MRPIERMQAISRGEFPDRIPFLPTILEHAASLIGRTPSEVCRDTDLMVESQLKAFETYEPDIISVGVDIYNIEAEALGCRIQFHRSNDVPAVAEHPLDEPSKLKGLSIPDPESSGRMPVMLESGRRILNQIGDQVTVSFPVCGAFSLAVDLRGFQALITDTFAEPSLVHDLLAFTTEVVKAYGGAAIKLGLRVSVFESWATIPIISPKMFRDLVLPYDRELIAHLRSVGAPGVPLILGGDTSPIVDALIEAGTSLVVADFPTDKAFFLRKAREAGVVLRGNIDPKLVQKGPVGKILDEAHSLIDICGGYPKFVLGTGVVAYNTPIENVLAIRRLLEELRR